VARWLANIATLILIAALVGVLVMVARRRQEEQRNIDDTVAAIHRIEQTIKVHAAAGVTTLNARGWPMTIEPAWFEQPVPRNFLLAGERPWIEIATAAEADLRHPRVRLAVDSSVAEFWYNPAQGVVRARVPVEVSDADATAMYNKVNGSGLGSIFEIEAASVRRRAPVEPAVVSAGG
jgi:hypothetical protein